MKRASSLGLLLSLILSGCGNGNSATSAPDSAASPTPDSAAPPAPDSAPPPANELLSGKSRVTNQVVSSSDATQLAADNLAFGVDLYSQLRASNAGKNFIFSQTSISLALAMLYGGAANNTAAQMATALHFTLPPERLHSAFNDLDLALLATPSGASLGSFQLSIANSTWVQTGSSILPAYLDLLAQDYGTGLFVEDFQTSPENARSDINQWVSDQTEQMIPELFAKGTITAVTQLVLADAMFFHGAWDVAFDPNSQDAVFYAPGGDVIVPMMSIGGSAIPAGTPHNATLWSGTGWTGVSLDYAGGTTSMVLLVPNAGTFDAFEQGLTASSLRSMLTATQAPYGYVSMPRFKFSTSSNLNSVLQALGMTDAFAPGIADLSGIDGQHDLSVGNVVHQAIITVDEQGTTAAAATGGGVIENYTSSPFVVDVPFLFFIRHNPTGAILFQGRVVDPSQAQ
jgi:serpin B